MAKAPSKPTSTATQKAVAPKEATSVKTAETKVTTAVKRKSAPVRKVTTAKTPAKKTVKAPTPKAVKAAKATLQVQLDNVAKRLVAADSRTKKNIKSLETDFDALKTQMSRTKASQTRLSTRVTKLSKTLTQDFESMQDDIRQNLANALHNPTIGSLQAALTRAENRLTESETAQDSAIIRINRHIADIAIIIEERLTDEAKTRTAAMAEMKRVMNTGQSQLVAAQAALSQTHKTHADAMELRFSNLQHESAEAIRSIGNKVVDVAEEMGRRRDVMATKIRQEVTDAKTTADAEFHQFRNVIERRLEALESSARDYDGQIDRAVAPLTSRIEGLEYGLTVKPEVQDAAPAFAPAPDIAPYTAPLSVVPAVAAAPVVDAFAPDPSLSVPIARPEPAPLELDTVAPNKAIPYTPEAYPSAYAAPVAAPTPDLQQNVQTPMAPEHYAPQAYTPAPVPQQPYAPPFPAVEDLAVTDSDLPYADPAYAETAQHSDESMSAARPGAFESLRKKSRKQTQEKLDEAATQRTSIMSARNMKLGGLVAALGIVGFVGAQTLANKPVGSPNAEFSVAQNQMQDDTRPSLGLPAGEILAANKQNPVFTQETIGQYADNRAVTVDVSGENALTTAAKSGDPAAQLQLGLNHLESGDLDNGVKLIRAAANQDQPAAQYRLAKLYETGQGVGQDSNTARQLTERAARGGNRIAMHDLALYFAEPGGRGGVEMDMPTAASWFEKAAERGVVDSQYNLGILFESGQGLPQDLESALVWYSIAGAQGDQMAASRVTVLRQTLNEEQLTRADNRITNFSPSRIDEEANGIFKNAAWAEPVKQAANSAAKAKVVKTQTMLNTLGYEVGKADGAAGPKTKNAIMSFQRSNGLEETGIVNADLIERLQVATTGA